MIDTEVSGKRLFSLVGKPDERLLWRTILWLEAMIIASVLVSFGLDRWALSYSGVYNYILILILVFAFSFGLALFLVNKPKVDGKGLLMFFVFLIGCLVLSYGTFMYEQGAADNAFFLPVVLTGAVLTVTGVGLMVIHLKHTSRVTGYYSMWLFGTLLILFMPLHELELILDYSGRDMLVGYLGLGISIIGSLSFAVEHRQGQKIESWVTAGDAKYIAGKFDEAIEYYDRALLVDDQNDFVWASKGVALLKLKLWSEALGCFDKAIALNPGMSLALGGKALALSNLKRYSEALEFHDMAIKSGRGAVGWNNKGNTLLRMGQPLEKALECYEQSLESNPDYEIAWYNKGETEYKLKRYGESVKSFTKAVELRPKFAAAWLHRAKALTAIGAKEDALFCYDMAIQLKPASTEAWAERKILLMSMKEERLKPIPLVSVPKTGVIFGPAAKVEDLLPGAETVDLPVSALEVKADGARVQALKLSAEGRYDKALKVLDNSLARAPEDPVTYMTKGILLSRVERLDDALLMFDKAHGLKPEWVGPLFSQGMVLAARADYDRALQKLDAALRIRPGYADAWSVKGIILGTQRKYEEAILCFDHVIELRPDDEESWRSKAIALNKLGRYEEAIESYEKLARFKPGIEETYGFLREEKQKLEGARALFRKGVDLAKSKEYDRAIEHLRKAIDLRPNYVDALYICGVVYGVVGEYPSAKTYFERVLELRPEHVEALYGKANIMLKEGNYAPSIKIFDRVLELDESHHDAWCDRGLALSRMGKHEEAMVCYDHALELASDLERGIKLRESCVKVIEEEKTRKKAPNTSNKSL